VRSSAEAKALAGDSENPQAQIFVVEESLGYLVNYVAKLFARWQASCLAMHGICPGQWPVLMFLWVQDGQSQRDLCRQVMVEDATMVRTLDRMERDGLVQRVRNKHDRRQINIFLTERGHMLRDVLTPCAISGNESSVRGFAEDEVQLLHSLLLRMITSLEQTLSTQQQILSTQQKEMDENT
jgi:DNA-binding MarR family transcriptional regulator